MTVPVPIKRLLLYILYTPSCLFSFSFTPFKNNSSFLSVKEILSFSLKISSNGIIYFVNKSDSNKIYRVSSSGNDVTKVADIKTVADSGQVEEANGKKYMFIKDNKLYYINTDDEDALWCYDLKSGENKRIISASIEILQNIDNTVFYKIDKEMGVYLYNYDTSFMSLVTKRRVKEFVIDNYAQIPTDVKIDNNYNI